MIGDGGFVFALEKRGYVKAGPWTPEASVEYPEAGKSANFCACSLCTCIIAVLVYFSETVAQRIPACRF